jgi:hypothetical protein
VDVEAATKYGETAAHLLAGLLGHAGALRLMVGAGVELHRPARGGWTVCSAALARGHTAVLDILAEPQQQQQMQHDHSREGADSSCTQRAHDVVLVRQQAAHETPACLSAACTTVLIPFGAVHPGAGALTVDSGFSNAWLAKLHTLWYTLPEEGQQRAACHRRRLYTDGEGWIEAQIQAVLEAAYLGLRQGGGEVELAGVHDQLDGRGLGKPQGGIDLRAGAVPRRVVVLTRMRFLCYHDAGGVMHPHVDLSKKELAGSQRASTHTFMSTAPG